MPCRQDPIMHRFHIPTMTCGGCLNAVTRALQKADPAVRIDGCLETREVTAVSDKSEAALLSALREAGYPAEPVRPAPAE
jgi:copper chaperone